MKRDTENKALSMFTLLNAHLDINVLVLDLAPENMPKAHVFGYGIYHGCRVLLNRKRSQFPDNVGCIIVQRQHGVLVRTLVVRIIFLPILSKIEISIYVEIWIAQNFFHIQKELFNIFSSHFFGSYTHPVTSPSRYIIHYQLIIVNSII